MESQAASQGREQLFFRVCAFIKRHHPDGVASTREIPSRAIDTARSSRAAAMRAAARALSRSAIGISTMPPSASIKNARFAQLSGPPSGSAARSMPPKSRSSAIPHGIRRSGAPGRKMTAQRHPARDREQATVPRAGRRRPRPAGSTAKSWAARSASSQLRARAGRHLRPWRRSSCAQNLGNGRARPAPSNRTRPGDCAATGDAAPSARLF